MHAFEKIEGDKINELLKDLCQNKVLLRVYVDGSGYEHLTLITDLEPDAKVPLLRIDTPEGLQKVLREKQTDRVGIEFKGWDRLTYKFDTHLDSVSDNKIWLRYPDHIRRYQFRDNFRIKAPRDAILTATIEGIKLSMRIDNISLGGAFCLCAIKHKSLVAANPRITNLSLIFTSLGQCLEIQIEKAEQKRIEPVTQQKKFGIAYEFVKMYPEAKRLLTQQIYELQRDYLQRRFEFGGPDPNGVSG